MRTDSTTFGELLALVTPFIKKKRRYDIKRIFILRKQRLFATLRYLLCIWTYLFEGLKFETAIAAQTLETIVIETYEAIIKVLKKYIKVNNYVLL